MNTVTPLRIGTRKSQLAMAQAQEVKELLGFCWPHLQEPGAVEIVPMNTQGDTIQDKPLMEIGGKGLFTEEIEAALHNKTIDIAVHSLKDMPTQLPEGLMIGCVLQREDPRDMLVGAGIESLKDIKRGAKIGTSSLRRSCQMRHVRPDIMVVPFRGNVQTRLRKLASKQADATLLAMAGLNRLKMYDLPGVALPIEHFVPAVAQGIIGIECRIDDQQTLETLAPMSHVETEIAATCERAFLRKLDGSCRTPIGGHAEVEDEEITFYGVVFSVDGTKKFSCKHKGNIEHAYALGVAAAEDLLLKAGNTIKIPE